IFFFREVDNGSLIDILLKLAGFTYGPLLGLFAFGILTKRKVASNAPLILCLIAMVVTLVLDFINNFQWYVSKIKLSSDAQQSIQTFSENLFGGYKIGVELLIINSIITFMLLYI